MKQYKELASSSLYSITNIINAYAKDGWELAGYCKDRNEFTAIIVREEAKASPKAGEWEYSYDKAGNIENAICTNCRASFNWYSAVKIFTYCPLCGSKNLNMS